MAREGAFLVLRGMLSGSGFSFFLPLYLPLPDLSLFWLDQAEDRSKKKIDGVGEEESRRV